MAKDTLDKRLEELLREKSDYQRNGDNNFSEFDFVTYEDEVNRVRTQSGNEGMSPESNRRSNAG